MSPDDEPRIERYVRRPGTLEPEERRAVERLLDEDPGAAAYASFLRGFYERLDEESDRTPDARVEAFVDDLFDEPEPPVVSVQPFRPSRKARPTVLAAETATPSDERRFSVLATLAAEAEQVLVRIVQDRETDRGRLYVLADPPARRAHVVVSFPEFGLDLVADEDGRLAFDLPLEIDAEQWAEARALVRRPVATDTIGPAETATMDLPSGGALRCERQEGTLTAVPVEDGADAPTLLTATAPDPSPHLLRLQPSTPTSCAADTEVPLTLRVYE